MKDQKTKTIKLNERQRAFLLHKIVLPVTTDRANDILSTEFNGSMHQTKQKKKW